MASVAGAHPVLCLAGNNKDMRVPPAKKYRIGARRRFASDDSITGVVSMPHKTFFFFFFPFFLVRRGYDS
jgi:hypothetical protein